MRAHGCFFLPLSPVSQQREDTVENTEESINTLSFYSGTNIKDQSVSAAKDKKKYHYYIHLQ